jgi:GDP-L-fucose synthase
MKKVLVTGSDGLVGSAIRRAAKHIEDLEFVFVTRKDADLTKREDVVKIYDTHRPDYVIHAAAKVGGIGGNMIGHAEYFFQNVLMNAHMIDLAYFYGVKKMLAFSSVCVFPDDVQILKEDVIHDGPPFAGNFAYAYAKRMVDVQIRAYKSQYGIKNYCSIIPGNIYGTHDLYNLQHGHVIPSLIHKIYKAVEKGEDLRVWGDGKSLREFIYADDIAKLLIKLLYLESIPERLIISGFEQHSIGDVVDILVSASGFNGHIIWEKDKPNGQRTRQSDLSLLKSLFPNFKPTPIQWGLNDAYAWFEANYPNVRL